MSVYSNNTFQQNTPNNAWFKIFQFVTPRAKVLDVGCSSGNLGAALKKDKNAYVVGIDIDADDVASAKKKLNQAELLSVETDDLQPLGKFDVIILADVIEHLVHPAAALKKLKQNLKPHGRIIFSIPNMANVTIRVDLLQGKFAYKDLGLLDKTHLHFYDKAEVERVFSSAGLNIVKTDSTIRPMPKAILKRELKKMGVELTNKLEQTLSTKEALIYQFVGYATPSTTARAKIIPQTSSSLDVISEEFDDLRAEYDKEIKSRDQTIQKLSRDIANLKTGVDQLSNELQAIKASKSWKLAQAVRQTRHPIKSRRKAR